MGRVGSGQSPFVSKPPNNLVGFWKIELIIYALNGIRPGFCSVLAPQESKIYGL